LLLWLAGFEAKSSISSIVHLHSTIGCT
jgi:hypothetical protein